MMIDVVFFDFGGVIAEEGWVNGLTDIAHHHGFLPHEFFDDACDVLWSTGYMYGRASETEFWEKLSEKYNFRQTPDEMRHIIFTRFKIRPEVLELIGKINRKGYRTAILSDQTNWLDEINGERPFFHLFERIFNSYHLGTGKKDTNIFPFVSKEMSVNIENCLFVDDNEGHIERAKSCGMQTVLFNDVESDIIKIASILKL